MTNFLKHFFFLSLINFLFSTSLHAIENDYIYQSRKLNLATGQKWQKLLHYESDLWWKSSEADGADFFLSPEGKNKPDLELEALILELEKGNTDVICRFPARSKYLKTQLNLPASWFDFSKCTKYKEFFDENFNKTVYLLFSSYYLESPASAFGHTMIRLGKYLPQTNKVVERSQKQSELLDTGIGYAANSMAENAFIYAFMGIVGGYKGTYSSIPYFYKIREYNDYESRDLWSYELNLSLEQKEVFIDHLWELGNTYFDYYYFTQNCSFHLITLLDAVNPDWKLGEKIRYYVIPVDTIKAVQSTPGLVKSITFRPSAKRVFEKSFSYLNSNDQKRLIDSVDNKSIDYLKDISDEKQKILWIDALIDFLDYKYSKEILLEKGEYFEWKKSVLASRSTLGLNPTPQYSEYPENERPDLGHDSIRTEIGGHYKDHYLTRFSYRFAMHDLLDPKIGQPPLASLNFFELSVDFDRTKLKFNSLKLFEIATLNPWTIYHRPLSLNTDIGFERNRLKNSCAGEGTFDCLTSYINAGLGITKAFNQSSASIFLQSQLFHSARFEHNLIARMGPRIILLAQFFQSKLQLGGDFYLLKNIIGKKNYHQLNFESRYYLNMKNGIKIKSTYEEDNWAHTLSYLYYF